MSTNVKFEVPTMKKLNDFQKLVYENGGPEKVKFWFPTEMREYIPLLELYMTSSRDREYCLMQIDMDDDYIYSFNKGYKVRLIPCDSKDEVHAPYGTYQDNFYSFYKEGILKIYNEGESAKYVDLTEKLTPSGYLVHHIQVIGDGN